MLRRAPSFVLRPDPPSRWIGLAAAAAAVALTTLLLYPLERIAPAVALGVVYMIAVLLISGVWGLWLGVATAVAGALAFNFFHIPPTGRFTVAETENWVALVVFLIAALLASSISELARARAAEAEERRREADLAAEMARLLLQGGALAPSLSMVARRLAQTLGVSSAAIEPSPVEAGDRRVAFPLRDGSRQIGTLLVPSDLPETTLRRLQERIVPSLEALLSAALERESLQSEVVETEALRRSDVIKTAVLRAVSHDLRSPLTAVVAAGDALASPTLTDDERSELAGVVATESRRLARMVDQLLDLSRLESGVAEPRRAWCSLEEIILASIEHLPGDQDAFSLTVAEDLPPLRADAAQLERAIANLLDNARRYSAGLPVSVRARMVGSRIVLRIVDRGPGIPAAQLTRIFEPFYRAGSEDGGHRGSGLGLSIARGFVEANGGQISAESLPGQGTTFVIEFPVAEEIPAVAQTAPGGTGR